MIEFEVPGVPAPQGSKTRTRFGMREDNPATRPWRAAVAWEATRAMDGITPIGGPAELHVVFFFPRPKSHFGTGRNADQLKAVAPAYCTSKPDIDKLLRAIGDAVTGICVRDDSQFVKVTGLKVYGTPKAAVLIQGAA
jgi:crossover junction endodeoxyribonuclease RusA